MKLSQPQAQVNSPTEQRNPRTVDIDLRSTLDILTLINAEDHLVPSAVHAALPQLAQAVDIAVAAIENGHRVHYVGAGTSGRLATLDAAELLPTFAIPSGWFRTHHAGGDHALKNAVENVEDDAESGARELSSSVEAGDFVLGLTASGRTPFVLGALSAAQGLGATTALILNNPRAEVSKEIDVVITIDTGPEVLAGSTRMKAGTAQKTALTAFSTAVMIKLGRTYSNLMVDMRATNAKLRGRMMRILKEATGASAQECAEALEHAGNDLKLALVQLISGATLEESKKALATHQGKTRQALTSLTRQ
jgi:N-acetylmuramic acid 6-phosphate etherase